MSLCWQILLPFTLLQIFMNGLALVYDWPDYTLTLMSSAGALAMGAVIYQAARRAGVPLQAPVTQRVGGVL
jgi:hypothetical protein